MLFIIGARRYSKVLQHIKKCETVSSAWLHSYNYWSDRINEEIKYYSTLKYLSPTYEIGKILHSLQVGSIGF
jgi:hypothetical protein